MKLHRVPVTVRLTLLFAITATLVLLALGWLIGRAVERHFAEQDLDQLNGKIQLTRHLLQQVRPGIDPAALEPLFHDALVGHHDLAVKVIDAKGRVLFATPDPGFPATLLQAADDIPRVWQAGGHPWRGVATRLPVARSDLSPAVVAVALDISHHEHFLRDFRHTLWWFVAGAAALTGFLGWLAVWRGLAPLKSLREEAASITANRLDRRLDEQAFPVELTDLARALNNMLARLEASFRRLQDFSSDLAHELRTPVSNLLTEAQVALSQPRSKEEYQTVLASGIEEYERLARMISDMLFLAQADDGRVVPHRETVDLGQQARELADFFDALAESQGVRLTTEGEAWVTGDALMLRRALANLMSNAIRHATAGGFVRVELTADKHTVRTRVENSGTAIAAEHLPRLFDRFYRVDPARSRAGEGAGLGLAITRAIVEAHGGSIGVRCEPGLVCFEILLPAAVSP